jgi:hypothetical protein
MCTVYKDTSDLVLTVYMDTKHGKLQGLLNMATLLHTV